MTELIAAMTMLKISDASQHKIIEDLKAGKDHAKASDDVVMPNSRD